MSTNVYSHSVQERAAIVTALVRQSVSSWLEIANCVKAAKRELTKLDFETFVELTGLTKPICDKLFRIAKCDKLYDPEINKHTSRLEGWTNLYELSKLNNPELDQFVTALDRDQTVSVTKDFIRSFRASSPKKPASPQQTIVAKIVLSDDDIGRLDLVEFEKLKDMIEQITRMIDAASPAISIDVLDNVIQKFEKQLSSEIIDESAQHDLAEDLLPLMPQPSIEEHSFV